MAVWLSAGRVTPVPVMVVARLPVVRVSVSGVEDSEGGEELVEGESPGGQHRQRRKKEQALWERSALPGGFRSGRGVRREGCELHTFSLLFFNSFLV
ncbi:hypothetical protein I4200191B4_17530 [Pseudoflavonifractor gallinarum]